MRILVLGATGFLGGHTVRHLRALSGVRVLVAARPSGRAPHPDLTPRPTPDLTVDLATADPAELAEALRALAPDAVINCAGAVGGGAVALTGTNARGPAVLCAALAAAAPGARLVHLGSAAEYGPGAPGRPLGESASTRPLGLYGASKLAGTLAVLDSGLDAVALRVFNPLGPGSPAASLPGRLAAELRLAMRDGALDAMDAAEPDATVRVGDLSAHRDFVDVRDVARAAGLAATEPGELPRLLNIGGGKARPVREVAEGLVRESGFRGAVEESGGGSARSAAVSWQQADIGAADRLLGWQPRYSFAESLTGLWAASKDPAETPAR
ncbi:NAD-dependent epimerase/dehydratase family protein [Streptomyces sp. NPDC059850]|uniref:NAD-dependent epimerase/dehydratase family protein n=1 Tax=Streptomyces sp. NPDC059850 TaxID=3346970 RepID=UPI003662C5F1